MGLHAHRGRGLHSRHSSRPSRSSTVQAQDDARAPVRSCRPSPKSGLRVLPIRAVEPSADVDHGRLSAAGNAQNTWTGRLRFCHNPRTGIPSASCLHGDLAQPVGETKTVTLSRTLHDRLLLGRQSGMYPTTEAVLGWDGGAAEGLLWHAIRSTPRSDYVSRRK